MSSQASTTDEVRIHRQFKDSYLPRRYTVTGGTFAEMKDTVKAAAGARFDGTMKSWLVVGDATIEALKAHGWNVEAVPALRYDWQGTIAVWRDNHARYQQDRERLEQELITIANVYTHLFDPRFGHDMTFPPTIYIEIHADADAVALALAQEAQTRASMEANYGIKDDGKSPYGGWVTIVSKAGRAATEQLFTKRFNEVYIAGGKTHDAYEDARVALEELDAIGGKPKVLVTVRADGDQFAFDVKEKNNDTR